MRASIEALAMAGVDHCEWGMDVEEWERDEEMTPPHLLADEEEEEEEEDGFTRKYFIKYYDELRFSSTAANDTSDISIKKRERQSGRIAEKLQKFLRFLRNIFDGNWSCNYKVSF